MKPPLHAAKQKASLAKSGLTSLATAAGCIHCVFLRVCNCRCVSMSLCLCVCVCQDEVTWLLSWAVRKDPALCRQSGTIKKHGKQTTMHSGWQPLPLTVCVFCLCLMPSYVHASTQWHAWRCQSRFGNAEWSTAGCLLQYQLRATQLTG